MKLKATLLATSVALALVGCGSDSSSDNNGNNGGSTELAKKAVIAVPTEGKFIDAKVGGLFYKSGDVTALTPAEGDFSIDPENPNVTFILGGKLDGEVRGLLIGSVSGRHIVTPYEAVGTQERAVNLARLLLTVNTGSIADAITIPDSISSPDEDMAKALEKIELDNLETAGDLLRLLTLDLVAEEVALSHFESEGSLKGLTRGSDVNLTHWARGSNWTFIERSASQRIRQSEGGNYELVIHADRTLGDDVFNKTAGLSSSAFKLEQDSFVALKGSNDGSISSGYAAQYLSCVKSGGEFGWDDPEADNKNPTCDGSTNIDVDSSVANMSNSPMYEYSLTDPTAVSQVDEKYSWEGEGDDSVASMGGAYECMAEKNCTEQQLTKYAVINREDGDTDLKEIISGSYDPITDVYVQVRSKQYLNNHPGRVAEDISFMYPVEKAGDDRYVDFEGSWIATETRPDCNLIAKATYVFTDTGLTMSGEEINGSDDSCSLVALESTPYTYQELAEKDYWWFATNAAGASKATLDQLNTTIRWNDRDSEIEPNSFKINRFSYIPAGQNWDRGVLTRYTLNDAGAKTATVTMQKI